MPLERGRGKQFLKIIEVMKGSGYMINGVEREFILRKVLFMRDIF